MWTAPQVFQLLFLPRTLRRVRRPLLQHAGPLPDGQSDTRPMPDGAGEYFLCAPETVAGIKHAVDLHAVAHPLLNFVKVAIVGVERVVSLLDGPISCRESPRHIYHHPTRHPGTQLMD